MMEISAERERPASTGTGRRVATLGVVLSLILLARFAWNIARTDVGPGLVADDWRRAVLFWLGRQPETPYRRAEFWFAEAERVRANPEADTRLLLGAAWALHRLPHFNFVDPPHAGFLQRARDLAAEATRRDPKNALGWRMRALLVGEDRPEPGYEAWLHEAQIHDPDNAFYDYVAAHLLWTHSTKLVFGDRDSYHEITDAEQFARGLTYFELAQRKTMAVRSIDEADKLLALFVAQSHLPKHLQAGALPACARNAWIGHWSPVNFFLTQVQASRVRLAGQRGDLAEVVRLLHENLRLAEDFTAGELPSVDEYWLSKKREAQSALADVMEELPVAMTAEEVSRLNSEMQASERTYRALQRVLFGMRASAASVLPPFDPRLLREAALRALVLLWPLGVTLWLIGRRGGIRSDQPAALDAPSHLWVWFAGLAISVLLFGLAPWNLVSREVQSHLIGFVLALVGMALLLGVPFWLLANILQNSKGKVAFAFAITLALAAGVLRRFEGITLISLAMARWFHSPTSYDSDYDSIATIEGTANEWLAYGGLLLGCVLALFLVALAWLRHQSRNRKGSVIVLSAWAKVRGLCLSVGRSSLAAALLLMMVYLAVAPIEIQRQQLAYEQQLPKLRGEITANGEFAAEVAKELATMP